MSTVKIVEAIDHETGETFHEGNIVDVKRNRNSFWFRGIILKIKPASILFLDSMQNKHEIATNSISGIVRVR